MNEIFIDARKKLGMTQENFASLLGISSSYLSQIERNARMPSDLMLRQFSDKTGINIDLLLDIKDSFKKEQRRKKLDVWERMYSKTSFQHADPKLKPKSSGNTPQISEKTEYRIPIIELEKALESGFYDDNFKPTGRGNEPITISPRMHEKGRNIYALRVTENDIGDMLPPQIDWIAFSPDSKFKNKDIVAVKVRGENIVIRRLYIKGDFVVLRYYKETHFEDRTCPKSEIEFCHPSVGMGFK